MPGKRQLDGRREDPDPRVATRLGRQHEHGLRQVHLAREPLHLLLAEASPVGEHGERVSDERRVREDVDDDVPEAAHESETMLQSRAAAHRAPCRSCLRGAGRAAPADPGRPRRRPCPRRTARPRRRPSGRDPDEPAPPRARDRAGACAPGRARAGARRKARAGCDPRGRSRGRRGARGDRRRRRPPARLLPDRGGADRRRRAGVPARRDAHDRPVVTAISVRGLRKSYGALEAVRGIDFEVARGEVFGLLGPNGAGKTTTVEILEGYRERSSGIVSVLGLDPGERSRQLREQVGIVLQSSGLYRHLTVKEVIAHWAQLYPRPRDVDEVITLAGLDEKRDARIRTLSGGQARRVDFALALIGDPELVFLDEPTTGFDPAARRAAWDVIRALKALGKTVVLTTHYLDEAQALADRVAIVK